MDTKHSWTYNRLQKQASEKAEHVASYQSIFCKWCCGNQLVSLSTELSIGNENNSLTLYAYVAGFGKSGHNIIISDKGLIVQCKFTEVEFSYNNN